MERRRAVRRRLQLELGVAALYRLWRLRGLGLTRRGRGGDVFKPYIGEGGEHAGPRAS